MNSSRIANASTKYAVRTYYVGSSVWSNRVCAVYAVRSGGNTCICRNPLEMVQAPAYCGDSSGLGSIKNEEKLYGDLRQDLHISEIESTYCCVCDCSTSREGLARPSTCIVAIRGSGEVEAWSPLRPRARGNIRDCRDCYLRLNSAGNDRKHQIVEQLTHVAREIRGPRPKNVHCDSWTPGSGSSRHQMSHFPPI